jgi:hypothetical protein
VRVSKQEHVLDRQTPQQESSLCLVLSRIEQIADKVGCGDGFYCSWRGCLFLFFFPKWGRSAKQHLLTGTASPAAVGHPSTHLTSWHPKILTRPAQDFRRGTYIPSHANHTIDRLSHQRRIEEGQYYEAHQQLRVVSQRYMKAGAHDAAIEILCAGARALLDAGQSGSGADLCLLLIEVYKAAQLAPDAVSKC